jgi:hypothetical protein
MTRRPRPMWRTSAMVAPSSGCTRTDSIGTATHMLRQNPRCCDNSWIVLARLPRPVRSSSPLSQFAFTLPQCRVELHTGSGDTRSARGIGEVLLKPRHAQLVASANVGKRAVTKTMMVFQPRANLFHFQTQDPL